MPIIGTIGTAKVTAHILHSSRATITIQESFENTQPPAAHMSAFARTIQQQSRAHPVTYSTPPYRHESHTITYPE